MLIKSGFIQNFKLGDNIAFNLKGLGLIYGYYYQEKQENQELLRKIMIVLIGSCTEAVLHDFYRRIRHNTNELIALSEKTVDAIRALTKIDKFELYITHAKKHDFFDAKDTDMYDALDELRKLRNRIHIQNDKHHFEADDFKAFNIERLEMAERCLEAVMKVMERKYPRDSSYEFVEPFELPWTDHWKPHEF